MSYNPSLHTTVGKSVGLYDARTADARTFYYEEDTDTYRAYSSKQEVFDYLPEVVRSPGFIVIINDGTTTVPYWFKDGKQDSDLVPFDETIESGSFKLNLDLEVITNLGRKIDITGLGDVLDNVIVDATYDDETSTLTLIRFNGSNIELNLHLKQREPKVEWYPLGEKDGVNQIFKVNEAYIPASTKVRVNGVLQQYGENYIELDNGDNGQVQIFTPPEFNDYPVIEYKPRNFT